MKKTFSRFGLELPDHLRAALDRYANEGCGTGGFLRACIENDLRRSVFLADDINQPLIPVIVAYIYRWFPATSHGSKESVDRWLLDGLNARREGRTFQGGIVCDGCDPEREFCPVHSVEKEWGVFNCSICLPSICVNVEHGRPKTKEVV